MGERRSISNSANDGDIAKIIMTNTATYKTSDLEREEEEGNVCLLYSSEIHQPILGHELEGYSNGGDMGERRSIRRTSFLPVQVCTYCSSQIFLPSCQQWCAREFLHCAIQLAQPAGVQSPLWRDIPGE